LLKHAEDSLKRAEEEARRDPTSQETKDRSYIALRAVQVALARGNVQEEQIAQEQAVRALSTEQTARNDAELAKIAVVQEEPRAKVISLSGSVLFEFGKATLLPEAEERLDALAAQLMNGNGQTFLLEGHTDSVGSPESNERLSQARAEAVVEYLASCGVSREAMRAVGRGAEQPVAENTTETGRAKNRRGELVGSPSQPTAGVGGAGASDGVKEAEPSPP